ncbi:MAG: hypothetical protein M1820_001973 [Bogoriella megaspora]|nr:MAG: hypothetical protein M1820_001973 [Bogoriella megaspora]
MSSQIDLSAQVGFEKAKAYDKSRPSYPREARSRIIDLAAGTGRFTELLVTENNDREIIAVEPHPQMRGILEDKCLTGFSVVDGMTTNMASISDHWADAVVIAKQVHQNVLNVLKSEDIEKNAKDEIEVHSRTDICWATAM